MKAMPILIALLFAGSAFALAPDDPLAKGFQNYIDATRGKAPEMKTQASSSSVPNITTIGPCGGGYQIISDYSDGHSTVSQAGPCAAGWIIVNQH